MTKLIPPRNNPGHPDDRREDDYYRILRDIEEKRFDLLRKKYCSLIGEYQDGGPEDKLEEKNKLSYSNLCAAGILPDKKNSLFSKWKSGGLWPFNPGQATKLLNFCWENTYWSSSEWRRRRAAEDPNSYFFNLAEKMHCERTTHQNLMAAAPGVYQVWSNSVVLPGKYVFGLFAIYEDCRTIKTLEVHRLPAIKNEEDGIIIQPFLEEISSGYMIKKSQQIMIHGFDLITHLFKFTSIIDTLRGTDGKGHFNVMKGIDIQIIGQNHFSRPKVFIRQNNIEDLLRVPHSSEEPSASPFPNISARDKEIFDGIKNLDIYSSLSLVEEKCVPDFVKAQLANINRL